MKIAIPASFKNIESMIETRFGRAAYFAIYENDSQNWSFIDNKQNLDATQGAGIQSAAAVINEGCSILLCSHCGPKAFNLLISKNIDLYLASNCTIQKAVEQFQEKKLQKLHSADVEGHW